MIHSESESIAPHIKEIISRRAPGSIYSRPKRLVILDIGSHSTPMQHPISSEQEFSHSS